MFKIEVISNFSAAHRLNNYRGKCENLHGHNWKVSARVSANATDAAGMAVDFHVLKGHLNSVLSRLDHSYLNDLSIFKKKNPTSENIAEYVFHNLKKLIGKGPVKVVSVSVWETQTSCATYSSD